MTGQRAAAGILASMLLAGCSVGFAGATFPATERALAQDGYADARITHIRDDRGDVLVVRYRGGPDPILERRRAERAAEVVWDGINAGFSEVELRVAGSPYSQGEIGYSYAGLSALFGSRGEVMQQPLGPPSGPAELWDDLVVEGRTILAATLLAAAAFVMASAVVMRRRRSSSL